MIHDTQYWLAEMERLEHAWSIGGRWAILSHAMSAAIAEEQAPATHEALLASARDAVACVAERRRVARMSFSRQIAMCLAFDTSAA